MKTKDDVTLTAEARRGKAPAVPEVLEEQAAQFPSPGTVPLEITLDIGKKVFGNGVGLTVRRTVHVAPSAQAQAEATTDSLLRFEDSLLRNADKLRQFLAATLTEVADVTRWDPSGRAYVQPRPAAPPVPASPLAPPLATTPAAPKAPVPPPVAATTTPAAAPPPAATAGKKAPPAIKLKI